MRGVTRGVERAEGFGRGWRGGTTFDVTKLVERQKRKESSSNDFSSSIPCDLPISLLICPYFHTPTSLVTPYVRCIPRYRDLRTVIHFGGAFAFACVRVCFSLFVPVYLCPFCYPSSSWHHCLINFGGSFVCVCVCLVVYLYPFRCRWSSRHGDSPNFGGNFVYVSVYDLVIVSFFVVARHRHRPLFQNFGRMFVCVCTRAYVCAHVCV